MLQFYDAHTHLQNVPSRDLPLTIKNIFGIVICSTHGNDYELVEKLSTVVAGPQASSVPSSSSTITSTTIHSSNGDSSTTNDAPITLSNPLITIPHYGIHPWYVPNDFCSPIDDVGQSSESSSSSSFCSTRTIDPDKSFQILSRLRTYLDRYPYAAVGETGLDRSKKGLLVSPWEIQLYAFEQQLKLALQYRRALSLHCVQAQTQMIDSFLKVFREITVKDTELFSLKGILLHSWGGNVTAAHTFRTLPFLQNVPIVFSFVGSITTTVCNEYITRTSPPSVTLSSSSFATVNTESVTTTAIPSSDHSGVIFRGASKDCLNCLTKLDHASIVFETDTPDQNFLHTLTKDYLQWVYDCLRIGLRDNNASSTISLSDNDCTYLLSSMKDIYDEYCRPLDSASSSSTVPDSHSLNSPAPNRSSLLPIVIFSAAIWRIVHSSSKYGEPLIGNGKPRKPHTTNTVAGSNDNPSFSFAFFTRPPGSYPYERIPKFIVEEYVNLIVANRTNLVRVFGMVEKPKE